MICRIIILACLIGLQYSCTYNDFDAKAAAADYCKCLEKEKKSGKDFFDSKFTCDGRLLSKNKFFRYDYIDNNYSYRYYPFLLSRTFIDSASAFNQIFRESIEKNCCKIAIMGCDKNDSFQNKMKTLEITK